MQSCNPCSNCCKTQPMHLRNTYVLHCYSTYVLHYWNHHHYRHLARTCSVSLSQPAFGQPTVAATAGSTSTAHTCTPCTPAQPTANRGAHSPPQPFRPSTNSWATCPLGVEHPACLLLCTGTSPSKACQHTQITLARGCCSACQSGYA
jgi:hypothetical protein